MSSRGRSFFKPRIRFGRHRYLAITGILLALSLQVCGCEPSQDAGLAFDTSVTGAAPLVASQKLSFYDPAQPERELSPAAIDGSQPRLLLRSMPDEAKSVPWAIPESVFFLYRSAWNGVGSPGRQPVATAFVLSVPDRHHRRFMRFLVTARHVVDPQWAHCAEGNPASIDLRLNRRSGGVGYETVSLQSERSRRFFTPADSTADIAILPLDQTLIPNLNDYKFIDVPFNFLPTETEIEQFRPNQPVMTARVITQAAVGSSSFPVFDSGVLSSVSGEAVDVQCGTPLELQPRTKLLNVWFINAGASLAASGAPVYIAVARGADTIKTPVLLGVQSVAWPDHGVAGITPSLILGDLIQSALRDQKASMDFYKGANTSSKENAPSLY